MTIFRFGSLHLGCLLLLLAGSWTGCATARNPHVALAPKYKPSNIYQLASFIPPPIRRVAILPITAAPNDWQGEAARPQLQGVLSSELGKSKRFECVTVTPEQIQSWTGRSTWRSDDVLPADFLNRLHETYDCDAVLFAHLSSYHAYQPIVLGWNLKLIEVTGRYVIWSADETFDANQANVASAAQYYHLKNTPTEQTSPERSSILMAPRNFAQYTLAALFETLPAR